MNLFTKMPQLTYFMLLCLCSKYVQWMMWIMSVKCNSMFLLYCMCVHTYIYVVITVCVPSDYCNILHPSNVHVCTYVQYVCT